MQHFSDDDAGYLNWIAENPDGFVLNIERSERPEYLVLHRANCWSIARPRDDGAYTDRNYQKVVASDLNDLRDFAREVGRADGSFSKVCGLCQPL